MAVIKLEDMSGTIEVTIFSKLYDQVKLSLQADQIYVVRGNIEEDTYTGGVRIVAESIDRLSAIRTRFARHLKIRLNDSTQAQSLMTRLPALLQPHCGGRCDIVITYQGQEADANLKLGENWRVTPTDELLEKIRAACPADQLVIGY